MNTEQAAQLIEQQQKIIDALSLVLPLAQSFLNDVFPFLAVLAALALGVILGRSCT